MLNNNQKNKTITGVALNTGYFNSYKISFSVKDTKRSIVFEFLL